MLWQTSECVMGMRADRESRRAAAPPTVCHQTHDTVADNVIVLFS